MNAPTVCCGGNTWRTALLFAASAVMAAAAVELSACSPKRCDFDPKHPENVVSSIQCPTGDVCYQGDCRRACEPGREGLTQCADSSECKDAALPNCVYSTTAGHSFCSSCDSTDTCVPILGICQPVADIQLPQPPNTTHMDPQPLPLDAGPIDGWVFERDAGQSHTTTQAISHTGGIRLSQIVESAGGTTAEHSLVDVSFYDVRSGTSSGPSTSTAAVEQCEILTPTVYSRRVAADIGAIHIDSATDYPGSLATSVVATFSPMQAAYLLNPAHLPEPELIFSVLSQHEHFVALSSNGAAGLTEGWGGTELYHVPYRLEVAPDTLTLLGAPIVVTDPPQDLSFTWTPLPHGVAGVAGERIELLIKGGRNILRCTEVETLQQSRDTIVVRSSVLQRFRRLDGVAGGEHRDVELKRVFATQLGIDPVPTSTTTVVEATLEISHTYVGTATF